MLRERLSRSAFGGHLNGVPMLALIRCRLVHPFGYCSVVVGAKSTGNDSYIPFANCWICGKESPQHVPTYATVKAYFDRISKQDKE